MYFILQYVDVNELIKPVIQKSILLAVNKARESAKSEQIAQLKAEQETSLALGTVHVAHLNFCSPSLY